MADSKPEINSASSSGLGHTIGGKKSNDFDGGIYTHDIALRPIRSKFSTHFTTRM